MNFFPNSNPTQTQFLTPTEIGQELGKLTGKPMSPNKVNKLLEALNLQRKVGNKWEPTKLGRGLCTMLPYIGKNNHAGYQVKWSTDVIVLLKDQI